MVSIRNPTYTHFYGWLPYTSRKNTISHLLIPMEICFHDVLSYTQSTIILSVPGHLPVNIVVFVLLMVAIIVEFWHKIFLEVQFLTISYGYIMQDATGNNEARN